MSAAAQLHKIVEDGLCLGCGLCAALAPKAIDIRQGEDGDLRPFANDDFNEAQMEIVAQTCPSMRLEGLPAP